MASGMACYHHSSTQAVSQCRKCGKGICKDCHDTFGVSSGDYAGESLCYDCTTQLVALNVAEVGKFKKQVLKERLGMYIGLALGFLFYLPVLFASSRDVPGGAKFFLFILFLGVGGSLGTILSVVFWSIKYIFKQAVNDSDEVGNSMVGALFYIAWKIITSPITTIYGFFKRNAQIKRATEIIASDSRVLREMRDYFAYTQSIERNKGVDLATLASQGSELFDNSYAKAVLNKGEKAAQAELRRSVVTISANGEIIRNFDNKPKRKAA